MRRNEKKQNNTIKVKHKVQLTKSIALVTHRKMGVITKGGVPMEHLKTLVNTRNVYDYEDYMYYRDGYTTPIEQATMEDKTKYLLTDIIGLPNVHELTLEEANTTYKKVYALNNRTVEEDVEAHIQNRKQA